jgi:hypothetical protein
VQPSGRRRGDIDIGFVGFQFTDRFVDLNGVAVGFVPFEKPGFLDRFAEFWNGDWSGHFYLSLRKR